VPGDERVSRASLVKQPGNLVGQRCYERPVGQGLADQGHATADPGLGAIGHRAQLRRQARLADAGLAGDQQHLSLASGRARERGHGRIPLGSPSDERR